MPKAVVTYVRSIQLVNVQLGKILKFGVLVIVGILLTEVISRYVFNAPTMWSMELSAFVFGAYFFLAGGYVLLRGGHVSMDLLYNRWSPKRRAITDLATFSLLAVYSLLFILGGIDDIIFSIRFGLTTSSMWAPPMAPIKIIIVTGVVLLFLQGIAFLIRDLATVRGKSIP